MSAAALGGAIPLPPFNSLQSPGDVAPQRSMMLEDSAKNSPIVNDNITALPSVPPEICQHEPHNIPASATAAPAAVAAEQVETNYLLDPSDDLDGYDFFFLLDF